MVRYVAMRAMREFDPDKPAMVHDQLNDDWFEWEPSKHGKEWHENGVTFQDGGLVQWSDLILDGWKPIGSPD